MYPGSCRSRNTDKFPGFSGLTNCLLCFSTVIGGNKSKYPPNLQEVCSKYLHSAFTQGVSANHACSSLLCQKCFESAMQLGDLAEKMEFFQKSMSELALLFSLEILHRRGKTVGDTDKDLGKKIIECEVSALGNFNSNNNTYSASFSSTEETASENSFGQISEPLIVPGVSGNSVDVTNDLKFANILRNCIGEGVNNEIVIPTVEFPTRTEESLKNIPMTDNYTHNDQTPKLPDFHSNGRNDVTSDPNNFKWIHNQNQESLPVCTKTDLSNSCTENEYDSASFGKCNEKLAQQHQLPISTNGLTNHMKPSTSQSQKSRKYRRKKEADTSSPGSGRESNQPGGLLPYSQAFYGKDFDDRLSLIRHKVKNEKSFKCTTCGKEFEWKSNLDRHIRAHTGEKPFQCDECDFSSNQVSHLKLHKNRRHSSSSNFRCKVCGKCFKTTVDVKQHFKRAHLTIDFAEDCVIKIS